MSTLQNPVACKRSITSLSTQSFLSRISIIWRIYILPTTSEGYKWLLAVMDLATNEFDIEPMKNKEAKTTLEAFKKMIKRKIIVLPKISLKTDGGSEFKGQFDKYMTDNKIFHKIAMPYRKTQMSPVEALNKSLARLLMTYLQNKTEEEGEDYNDWTDIIGEVRTELNKYRERDLDKVKEYQAHHSFNPGSEKAKFKVGDIVHYKLSRPVDTYGNLLTSNFREGDRKYSVDTREVTSVLPYPDEPWYRYKLKGLSHVSFSKHELKPAKEKVETTYVVKKIIGKKTINKVKHYLVWWKGFLKNDSTWEPEDQLIEDGFENYIKAFKQG